MPPAPSQSSWLALIKPAAALRLPCLDASGKRPRHETTESQICDLCHIQNVTALYSAVCRLNVPRVRMLLRAGANYNIVLRSQSRDNGWTAYKLSLLLASYANRAPNCVDQPAFDDVEADDGLNCLLVLLGAGAPVDCELLDGFIGSTPLHLACQYGAYPVVAMLLMHGAPVGTRVVGPGLVMHGETPAAVTCRDNYPDCLELLAEHGGLLPGPAEGMGEDDESGLLLQACSGVAIDCAKILLSHGFDPEQLLNGVLPLMVAMSKRSPDLVSCLLSAKASPMTRDASGFNALDVRLAFRDTTESEEDEQIATLLKASAAIVPCDQCGAERPRRGQGKMPVCARCRGVQYCCTECQEAHWPQHKERCKQFRKVRDQLSTLSAMVASGEMQHGNRMDNSNHVR